LLQIYFRHHRTKQKSASSTAHMEVLNWLYTLFKSCFRFGIFTNAPNNYAQLDEDEDDVSSSSDTINAETKRLLTLIERDGVLHPRFFTAGDFKAATEKAKRDYKLLLVYLHSEDHQDTPDFCRYVYSLICSFIID
jgi:FAS-associated factor 2